jgi:hypothetical protein
MQAQTAMSNLQSFMWIDFRRAEIEQEQSWDHRAAGHSATCHSRIPALNCGRNWVSTRNAVVVIGLKMTRFIVSSFTPKLPPGTIFHSSPDL